jgi:hypothetical protein
VKSELFNHFELYHFVHFVPFDPLVIFFGQSPSPIQALTSSIFKALSDNEKRCCYTERYAEQEL